MENQGEIKKTGNRKVKVSFVTMVFLLAGFAIAAWMKADFQLYLCYAGGVTGANLGFMWGNSKEHLAGTKKE
jgi:hypothetical protein